MAHGLYGPKIKKIAYLTNTVARDYNQIVCHWGS
jgi:hypothetical protein